MDDVDDVQSVEFVKQQLSDTYLAFLPKNTSGYTTINQIVDVQIPRTQHVLRLCKAYIQAEVQFKYTINGAEFTQPIDAEGNTSKHTYVGLLNAANIFDQVQIKNNGKTVWTDTFAQVNSRVWQLSKSNHWLSSQEASFINYEDVRLNEGLMLFEVKDKMSGEHELVSRLRIPLPCLFQCFDCCDNFSTSQLNDDVTFSMQFSPLSKYMCVVLTDDNYKVKQVIPLGQGQSGHINAFQFDTNKDHYIEFSEGDDYHIKSLKIVSPGHYPTEEERVQFDGAIANGTVTYPFKNCDIQGMTTDYAVNNGTTSITNSLNFSSNANNIWAILMLSTHNHSFVVYDKPYIGNISCNLSEVYHLANEHVHKGSTYQEDNDMYYDLLNAFGIDTYKNFNRFDHAITHDYASKGPSDTPSKVNTWGSYVQFYKVGAGNMMGISADFFSNLITYSTTSLFNTAKPANTPNNHAGSVVYCCQMSYRLLTYKDGGIDIVTPFHEEMNARNFGNEANIPSHGFAISGIAKTLIPSAGGLFPRIGKAIGDNIRRIKSNKNTTYAYSKLGKDGYDKHRYIIEKNETMGTGKFKKFINNLVEADKQLNENHGLLVRHGDEASAEAKIEAPEPVDLNLLNLTSLYKQSYEADFADKEYKMLFPVDYKWGLNRYKLMLTSWGNETAATNIQHGFRDWMKRTWGKITGFFKGIGREAKTGAVNLIKQVPGLVKDYATQILTGKLNINDVPSNLKNQVLSVISNNQLTGTPIDGSMAKAIEMYKKIKDGSMSWNDVPNDVYSIIKNLSLNENNKNGLLVRHGFNDYLSIRPTVPYSVTKRRISQLLDKNPMLLRQKDLKKIYRFKYLADRGIVDPSHGLLPDVLGKNPYFKLPRYLQPTGASTQLRSTTEAVNKPEVWKKSWKEYRDVNTKPELKRIMANIKTRYSPEFDSRDPSLIQQRNRLMQKVIELRKKRLMAKQRLMTGTDNEASHGMISDLGKKILRNKIKLRLMNARI